MSRRLVRQPGMPPRDIDDGPALHVRRYSLSTGVALGGIYVVGKSTATQHAEQVAAYKAREKVT